MIASNDSRNMKFGWIDKNDYVLLFIISVKNPQF